ncbi:MAG: DUF1622 domain-containing protein [Saprospiraceae bacterium]|nr:DUF1622 domain-containing protein [Saprospiraceae bacterium]
MELLSMKAPILENVIEFVEIISAIVLLTGFAKGIIGFIISEWKYLRRKIERVNLLELRPVVGNYILLGLDFYIVSDILSTMLKPELEELISLTVIGLLRTVIGYFLAKEIEHKAS